MPPNIVSIAFETESKFDAETSLNAARAHTVLVMLPSASKALSASLYCEMRAEHSWVYCQTRRRSRRRNGRRRKRGSERRWWPRKRESSNMCRARESSRFFDLAQEGRRHGGDSVCLKIPVVLDSCTQCKMHCCAVATETNPVDHFVVSWVDFGC